MAIDQPPLTRDLLQKLADDRLREPRVLQDTGCFSGAYYLAGYAAEIGLKACIARQFRAEIIPDRKLVERTYSHDIRELLKLAGLAEALKGEQAVSQRFAAFWSIVTDWSERARYRIIGQSEAEDLIRALNDPEDGVLRWIRASW